MTSYNDEQADFAYFAKQDADWEEQEAQEAEQAKAEEDEADARAGMAWWNGLTAVDRMAWMAQTNTAVVADAWEAFKTSRDEALKFRAMLDRVSRADP